VYERLVGWGEETITVDVVSAARVRRGKARERSVVVVSESNILSMCMFISEFEYVCVRSER